MKKIELKEDFNSLKSSLLEFYENMEVVEDSGRGNADPGEVPDNEQLTADTTVKNIREGISRVNSIFESLTPLVSNL